MRLPLPTLQRLPGLLLALLTAASAAAPPAPACKRFTLQGEVHAGQAWQRPIGGGLVFRLAPDEDTGWQFGIRPARPRAGDELDYVSMMTLPLRGQHVTMMDTSYGTPAQDVVAYGRRRFAFLLRPQDAPRAGQLLHRLLWPLPDDDFEQTRQALRQLQSLPAGSGELRIIRSRIERGRSAAGSTEPDAHFGRLHHLAFRLTLVVPATAQTPAGVPTAPAACVRPADV
ncbi:MAG: hypothetical protein ACK4PH_06215 [Aquincola tertiaricarbonis]